LEILRSPSVIFGSSDGLSGSTASRKTADVPNASGAKIVASSQPRAPVTVAVLPIDASIPSRVYEPARGAA
jgi:hypothetical protein